MFFHNLLCICSIFLLVFTSTTSAIDCQACPGQCPQAYGSHTVNLLVERSSPTHVEYTGSDKSLLAEFYVDLVQATNPSQTAVELSNATPNKIQTVYTLNFGGVPHSYYLFNADNCQVTLNVPIDSFQGARVQIIRS